MIHLFVPLIVVILLVGVFVLSRFSSRLDRAVTQLSLTLFGRYLDREGLRRQRELERMRAAHIAQTYGRFAARTLFISVSAGVVGSVLFVYSLGALLGQLGVDPVDLRQALAAGVGSVFPMGLRRLSPSVLVFFSGTETVGQVTPWGLVGILLVALIFVGTPVAAIGYGARWLYLDQIAIRRANRIDTTLPRTVAFIYALSRSGMPFPKVLETLAENSEVYGEAATEFSVAVRDTNTFGSDIITALHDTAERTPSEDLEEFVENLASVLDSGQALASFLHDQYERYQDEIAARQQTYLELLETFAEIYVTVLVAGPLFFITVLVVIGLVIADTLPLIQLITYLGIPLGSVAFIIYIDSITSSFEAAGWEGRLAVSSDATADRSDTEVPGVPSVTTDGGTVSGASTLTRNIAVLRAYDRLEPIRAWIEEPKAHVLRDPLASLYLTVPLALGWVVLTVDIATVGSLLSADSVQVYALLDSVDQSIVEGMLLVIGVLSLLYELRKRTYRDIENATPDFLDRMASVNEAGLTVVASIKRVSQTDLGVLGEELQRATRDIEWGSDVASALRRMSNRTRAPMLTRSMALVTNAMAASGDISPVLRIAANETEEARALRQERRQQMLTYLVVIYVSFFVFIGIIVALTVSFIPAIESAVSSATFSESSSITTGVFSGLDEVNTDAYTLLFFHVTLIQGLFSGLIAGQLGEGSATDGLKHATVLVLFTYLVFQLL